MIYTISEIVWSRSVLVAEVRITFYSAVTLNYHTEYTRHDTPTSCHSACLQKQGWTIVHFKRLGSRVFHDSFNQCVFFFSKQSTYCKTNAILTWENFIRFFERRFLNLLHEYRNVNGTLQWEKSCSAAFSCRDLDTADGLPVLNGTADVNARFSI